MSSIKNDRGIPFSATANGTTSATASKTGATNVTYYVTDISGSSDLAQATIQVKDGTTVIWQDQLSQTAAGSTSYNHSFVTPLKATNGNSVSVVVTGTSVSNANIAGFAINNS